MNKTLNGELSAYDTLVNFGSLEHVYNAPQALLNVSELCRNGGQILHLLPGNNFCGHGFWRFPQNYSFHCTAGRIATRRRESFWRVNIELIIGMR